MLNVMQIDRLVAVLRAQQAPVVDRLAPGLSDAEMDALVGPLGLSLPSEARIWWGYHNGAHPRRGDGPHSTSLSPAWWWAPLEAVVEQCRDIRQSIDPAMWMEPWLPVVIGDGELVIDTAGGRDGACPVHVIDFEGDDEFVGPRHVPTLPTLGALVDAWIAALAGRAYQWAPELGYFDAIDWGRLGMLRIPDGVW